ncbi:MAG: hypothetical protein ABI900_08045 [Betaproteobacteria bacterium]
MTEKAMLSVRTRRWTTRAGWADRLALAPRAELEQAALRLSIGVLVLAVLLWRFLSVAAPSADLSHMVWVMTGFVAFAAAIILWILARPRPSPLRLILGIISDNAAVAYFMLLTGEAGAVIVGVFLFLTFGNGFRYGRRYLALSQGIALLGFALVLSVSDFWSHNLAVGVGLLISLIVLPFYVGLLAERLKKEKERADEARMQVEQALKACLERERRGESSVRGS